RRMASTSARSGSRTPKRSGTSSSAVLPRSAASTRRELAETACAQGRHVMLTEELRRQLWPARHLGLRVDRLDVILDRVARDEESVGDLLVREPAHEEPCDLALARGEPVQLELQRRRL